MKEKAKDKLQNTMMGKLHSKVQEKMLAMAAAKAGDRKSVV